jgi:hypothetical protein
MTPNKDSKLAVAQGYLILPIFQVASYDTPKVAGQLPLFATGFPPWKSFQ